MHIQDRYTWLKYFDFAIVDFFALIISLVFAFVIKFGWNTDLLFSIIWIRLICLILVLDLLGTIIMNPYNGVFKRPYYMDILRGVKLTLFNVITTALILYVFKIGTTFSRSVFIMTYCFYFVLSLLLKYVWKLIVSKWKIGLRNIKAFPVFVFTDKEHVSEVYANVSAGDFDRYDIRGLFITDGDESDRIDGAEVVKSDPVGFVIKNNINDVLVASNPGSISDDDYKKLIENAVNIHVIVESVIGMQTENQFVSDVGVYKTLSVGTFSFRPGQVIYLGIKRVLEILLGLVGLILLLPITLIVKLAYLISGDKDRIFFRQDRVGLNGKPIKILKYRTMVTDADDVLEDILRDDKYRGEWEMNQKLKDDPRITKVGRVLRRLSIDEFPQVVNVFLGNMSFVGPRPLVEGELEAHDGLKLYQRVKPGITGWWGCNGRSNIEYRERLELEYYYVRNFSFYLDVLCVLRTIAQVIRGSGAE